MWEETPVTAWRRWLAAEPAEPWLTYLNFQANHFPYEVPREAPRPFAPHRLDFPASFLSYPRERVPTMLNRFYNALRYTDHWLGEVVAELDRRGVWERTVLVVVSDHGEAFYEHAQPTHGTALYEE
ncbi:MAG: sulfatase-like hydrolase/transferase, partial [Rhodovibrionaceae bacterium]|nr:sulfatase-like hydrolase/transferase [Rhodovibrionaceae bacterium]